MGGERSEHSTHSPAFYSWRRKRDSSLHKAAATNYTEAETGIHVFIPSQHPFIIFKILLISFFPEVSQHKIFNFILFIFMKFLIHKVFCAFVQEKKKNISVRLLK